MEKNIPEAVHYALSGKRAYNHHMEIIRTMESGNIKAAVKAMAFHNSILADYIDEEIRKLDSRRDEACG